MVNYELFKQPIAKVIYDGNKRFVDEEGYIEQFMKSIFIDPDELRRKKELEEEKVRLQREEDLIVKNKLKEEEARLLKEQQLFAEKKAVQEAEIMKKIVAEKIKSTHKKESSKNRELNFNETRSKLREDEVYLKISFEKKKITENQNKIIKKNVETNLLKSFAENERVKIRSKSTFQKVNETPDNPVIELLKREALAKATSSDLMLEVKLKNKQILLNQGIMHQELMRNMKTAVKTEKDNAFQSNKSQKNLKRKGVIGITTDLEKRTFKTIYMITLVSNGSKTNYKKETYTWGLSYYYKNNEPINEQTYYSELSFYDVPL